jgi:hypothetical protein
MPERLDRVTITLRRGDVTFNWATRQILMGRLQDVQTKARIRDSFNTEDPSAAIVLNHGQRTALLIVLEQWSLAGDGPGAMPHSLFELRNALYGDLHDAA